MQARRLCFDMLRLDWNELRMNLGGLDVHSPSHRGVMNQNPSHQMSFLLL
jgi:hypothetical protein